MDTDKDANASQDSEKMETDTPKEEGDAPKGSKPSY